MSANKTITKISKVVSELYNIVRSKIKYKPINPQISFLSIVLKLAVQCTMSTDWVYEPKKPLSLSFHPLHHVSIDVTCRQLPLRCVQYQFTFPRRRLSSTTTTVPTNKPRSDQLKIENWLNNNFLSGWKYYMYDTVNIWRSVAVATGLFRFHSIPIGFDLSGV